MRDRRECEENLPKNALTACLPHQLNIIIPDGQTSFKGKDLCSKIVLNLRSNKTLTENILPRNCRLVVKR